MKATDREIIELKIRLLKIDLAAANKAYSDMHQIDMQSGEGSENRRWAYRTEGQIKALEWVLNKFTD